MAAYRSADSGGRAPRVAMIAENREASFGAWCDVEISFVWSHYVEAVSRAGGAPVLVPAVDLYESSPDLAIDGADGLLLTGGRDITAGFYGAEPHPANEAGDPRRDRVEAAIASRALELGLPLLGVCRGMQLLNLIRGGGLEQHLADPEGIHRGTPGEFVGHSVALSIGSRIASILGGEMTSVRSHHHQGIGAIGSGLVATGHAPDGIVEVLESADEGFCLAVLWHPEEDLLGGGLSIYRALVEAASRQAEPVA